MIRAVPQPMFLHLLSDLGHRPAAVQFIPAGDGPADLHALLADPEFPELAARIPCLMVEEDAARLAPAVLDAARGAGCEVVGGDAIRTAETLAEAEAKPGATTRYLAGNWYLHPPQKPTNDQTGSRALALKLVQLVAADADTHDIEEIFRHEPTLSYHLLRLVNSPGMGNNGRHINSFAQAIIILGRRQLRRWLNLILFAARRDDPRAAMLLGRVTLRARSLELLAREAGFDRERQERAFMAGMFSLLGVLFGMPLADILRPLNLEADVASAALRREGDLGRLLAAVEAGERGDAAAVDDLLGPIVPVGVTLGHVQIEACLWMLELIQESAAHAQA